jgi:HlyD family secretion protein
MHTNTATNALILPTDAVHNADSDQPWVQVIRDGKAQQQEIQTGIRGIGNTQVLDGLKEGDWVITQTNIKNDSRVEPKAREKQIIRGVDLSNGFK